MPDLPFIHLHAHSAYSLAEGAIPVKDIVKMCKKAHMPAVAVTDTGNLFGAMEFATEAAKAGVQPVLGCQLSMGLEGHELVLLVQDEDGYRNLSRLVSDAFIEGDPAQAVHVDWANLEKYAAGLICLTGGIKGPVSQYLLHNQAKQAEAALLRLKAIFADRLYIELQRHGWPEEGRVEEMLLDFAYAHDLPIVATNDCYFARRETYEAHDALLCIAEGRYVTEENRRRVTPEHYFKSAEEMTDLFTDLPEAIENTSVIARRCHYLLQPIQPILPPFATEGGLSEIEALKEQAIRGLEWRLESFVLPIDPDADAQPYRDRLAFELDVIIKMGFAGYFLIVSDFIIWAKDHHIPVGPGRGSGAGSVVAWALKITDLDPLRFGLLFERFLNPERVSMPDFDVDFCQDRRDEVIRYVQDKYGHDRVAQIITFGKLQARAVLRDVGRVLQMPYGQVDRICKMIPNNPAHPVTLAEALEGDAELRAEREKDEVADKLISIALQLEGLYRHASTHAAGVVIADRPLHELVPLYRDPRSTMPVTQFNMKYIEQAGLLKFDFLGLKTMTVIQKTVDIINASDGDPLDILKVPLDDVKTYQMLSDGRTVGVFQLESSGMRSTLTGMKPDRFEDIIALVSLYRPGPMDNIPSYIAIKDGRQQPDYMHPLLKPYLEETYGIIVYQEQVMQAAQALSGYTLGGADLLRRAMGKKIASEMAAQRQTFVDGAAAHNGLVPERASEIFDQIDKFAGYGFNKSHAAAYALIAYWTGWLKANYPVEFMTASMTLDLQNTDKLALFKQELDRLRIPLLPPDVNRSQADFIVEGKTVRYALAGLKGVGEAAMQRLVAEREANGPYKSLFDLSLRLEPGSMNKRQFESLASAGAFDSLNDNRAQVHDSAEILLRYAQAQAEEKASGQVSLFGGPTTASLAEPPLAASARWDPLDQLRHEFDAVGFYLSAHPLDAKALQLDKLNVMSAAQVEAALTQQATIVTDMAGVLLKKQIKVSPKSGNKYAFLQLSDTSGVYEAMLFSEVLYTARDYLDEGVSLLLKVVAEQKNDQTRYSVQAIQPLEKALNGRLREIRFALARPDGLGQLRSLMNTEGPGPLTLYVEIPLEDGALAELQLPGHWAFSPEARNALMRSGAVSGFREA